MFRKGLMLGAALIALYIAVEYATGFSSDTTAASNGAANVIKAFQGRG
jgi:hypothetical protein